MSYILEALKKAQAERQIGSTPNIHAPTLAGAPTGQGARVKSTPVIVAMVLMGAAIAGLATMLVRQQSAVSPPPAAAAHAAAAAPAATAPAAVAQVSGANVPQLAAAPQAMQPAAVPLPAQPPVAGAEATRPDAAPIAAQPLVAGAHAPQPVAAMPVEAPRATDSRVSQPPPKKAPAASHSAESPRLAASRQAVAATSGANMSSSVSSTASTAGAPAAPAVAPVAASQAQSQVQSQAPAPVEEHVQSIHELPEPIQRAIPQITFGGYMYSKNPADRLLIIDKVLRKEGDEVAPGLVLVKLLPKQAIFGFRGYRYRVAL